MPLKLLCTAVIWLVFLVLTHAAHSAPIRIAITGPEGRQYQGELFLPETSAPVPVVLMVPGTDGVDQRQDLYRSRFLPEGIGTFTLDIKSGVFTSRRNRPRSNFFVPVVAEALRALRRRSDVDADHIGIMGWSFGGAVAFGLADRRNSRDLLKQGEEGFAAYAGIYGGCTRSSRRLNVPTLILIGTADTITDPDRCRYFATLYPSATVVFLEGAHHGFDKEGIDRNRGGRIMQWDRNAAATSLGRVVDFFRKHLTKGT